ncbi:MAG: class I SAM-dependent methyltransferase [Fibromonadaceae bacterium]|jgi:SAM-dependent methyltransferase|nr:class I SAM-dependent methyltransferase [Fibromonadaceae bacterium]
MENFGLYGNTAFLYDFDNRQLLNDDIKFALDYVKQQKGDIMEIACGTGRMTIPIFEEIKGSGRSILAFDLSDSMLDVLRGKLSPEKNHSCLQVEKGDMSNFYFNRKFGLVLLMWRAFQHLIDTEGAQNCLKCIYEHMSDDAVLLFNVFLPKDSYGKEWIGKEFITYDLIDKKNDARIIRSTKNIDSDEARQIIRYLTRYDLTLKDGEKKHYEDTIVYKYYYPEQIKELLKKHNFDIIEELNSLNPQNKEITDQYYVLKKAKV